MPTTHLAYAGAYKIKDSGFRGIALNKLTKEIARGEVRETIEQARNDAKTFVWAWAKGRNMATGTLRNTPGLQWRMNYFIRTDEVEAGERKQEAVA